MQERVKEILSFEPHPMKLNDLTFKKYITSAKIRSRTKKLASKINSDYQKKTPLLLPVLNGSFMFAADLMKQLKVNCRVSFVKHASYEGTSSTSLKTLIGLNESVFGLDIIVVEDIMDTGETLSRVINELKTLGAKSVEIAVLLRKAKAKKHPLKPKYIGFEIADPFVVGYGLDYDGLGRNFADVYQLGKDKNT
jgi:hypoxanthine phosphoribosyltransferase